MSINQKSYQNVPPEIDSYSVHHTRYGVYARGMLPIEAFSDLGKRAGKKAVIDTAVQRHYHASLAIANDEEASKQWRKELGIGPENPDWLKSGDCGISSMTIYAILTKQWHILERGSDDFDVPHDPQDFGRCHRLLQRFPEWRARLPEVAEQCPFWEPYVRDWDTMTRLYEEEEPNNSAPKLYALMLEVHEESRAIRNQTEPNRHAIHITRASAARIRDNILKKKTATKKAKAPRTARKRK